MEKSYNIIKNLIESETQNIREIGIVIIKANGLNNYFKYIIKNDITLFKLFLNKCGIDSVLFFLIIDKVNKLKNKYHTTYYNKYKLFLILQLEDECVYWKSLIKNIFYNSSLKTTYHYKSINQQYSRWCSKGIFKRAFENYSVVKNVDTPITIEINKIKNENYVIDFKSDLFIDSSNLNNMNGSEYIVINFENKKKKITKITEICDVNGFIFSIYPNEPKSKYIDYLDKNVGTAPHDSKCINKAINKLL